MSGECYEYRLRVEGLRVEFVTHYSMEQAFLNGQERLRGLQHEGLVLKEEADPALAELTGGSMRATIVDHCEDDAITRELVQIPEAQTFLVADIDVVDTRTPPLLGDPALGSALDCYLFLQDDTGFAPGDHVHIDTEVFRLDQYVGQRDPNPGGDESALASCWVARRAQWDTIPQAHDYADAYSANARFPRVSKTRPPFIEGRRAFLYEYGSEDNPQGAGNLIWRGVVSTDAKLGDTASAYTITIDPISAVLNTDFGADIGREIKPRGIYYSAANALFVRVFVGRFGVIDPTRETYERISSVAEVAIYGWFPDNRAFCDYVNEQLAIATNDWTDGHATAGRNTITANFKLPRNTDGTRFSPPAGVANPFGALMEDWPVCFTFEPLGDDDYKISVIPTPLGLQPLPAPFFPDNDTVTYQVVFSDAPEGTRSFASPGGSFTSTGWTLWEGRGARGPQAYPQRDLTTHPLDGYAGGPVWHRDLVDTGYLEIQPTDNSPNERTAGNGRSVPRFIVGEHPHPRDEADVHLIDPSAPNDIIYFDALSLAGVTNMLVNWKGFIPQGAQSVPEDDDREQNYSVEEYNGPGATGEVVHVLSPTLGDGQYVYSRGLDSEFQLARNLLDPADRGSLADLRNALVDLGPRLGNQGGTPFLYAGDIEPLPIATLAMDRTFALERYYRASGTVNLGELLAHEARLLGAFWGTGADGRIRLVPLRRPTEVQAPDFTLDATTVLTDAGFPQWERNALGLVNTIAFKTGYSYLEGEHVGHEYQIRNNQVGERKGTTRTLEIAPFSTRAGRDRDALEADRLTQEQIEEVSSKVFDMFGGEHIIVTVDVPYTLRNVALIGSICEFDICQLPNTRTGRRGLVDARGVVLSRSFDLDTARGTLKVLYYPNPRPAWTPSALGFSGTPSGATNTVGGQLQPFTHRLAPEASSIDELFQPGWLVRVNYLNSATPGTVATIDSMTVATPDAATFNLTSLSGSWPGTAAGASVWLSFPPADTPGLPEEQREAWAYFSEGKDAAGSRVRVSIDGGHMQSDVFGG